jgi:hypothetical protein
MTSDGCSDPILPSAEMWDVLSRVRQLDPTSEEVAIRGYLCEIAEAEAVLDTVDLGDAPVSISFSASWPEGCER